MAKNSFLSYEPPFRPPFEYRAAWGWGIAGTITLLLAFGTGAPRVEAFLLAAAAWAVAAWRWQQGARCQYTRDRLKHAGKLWFMSPERADELSGHVLIVGSTRTGKAQPLSAKVHTPYARLGGPKKK